MNLLTSKLKQKYAKHFPELFGHEDDDGVETRNCRGVITYPDGSRYEGELKNGKPHGYGSFIHGPANSWPGDFIGGKWDEGVQSESFLYCCSNGTYALIQTGVTVYPDGSTRSLVRINGHKNGKGVIHASDAGTVYFENMKSIQNASGDLVVISRSAEVSIRNEAGQEKERYKLPYGALVHYKDGGTVKAKDKIVDWDPHTHPIIAEHSGKVVFVDFAEGVTVTKSSDPMTGLSFFDMIEEGERPVAAKDMKPMIKLVDEKDNDLILSTHYLPSGIKISLVDGQNVAAGERLAVFYDHDLPYHYKGEKKDGVRHGKGVASYLNGSSKSGIWINGRFNGDGLIQAFVGGIVSFKYMKSVQNSKGYSVVVSYFAEAFIRNESGEVKERYTLPYGAKVYFNNGDTVKEMDKIAEWGNTDKRRRQIISEYSGYAMLVDFSEGKTAFPKCDNSTGLCTYVIPQKTDRNPNEKELMPMIQVVDETDREKILSIHHLPYSVEIHQLVSNNQLISAGDVLAFWNEW